MELPRWRQPRPASRAVDPAPQLPAPDLRRGSVRTNFARSSCEVRATALPSVASGGSRRALQNRDSGVHRCARLCRLHCRPRWASQALATWGERCLSSSSTKQFATAVTGSAWSWATSSVCSHSRGWPADGEPRPVCRRPAGARLTACPRARKPSGASYEASAVPRASRCAPARAPLALGMEASTRAALAADFCCQAKAGSRGSRALASRVTKRDNRALRRPVGGTHDET
jgi:hypothetical protein